MMLKSERNRQTKGCFKKGVKSYRLDNIIYNKCIGNFASPIDYFIDAFEMYEKGQLPYPGTLGEQPNKIIEIFNLIHRKRSEYIAEQKE